MVGLEDVYDEEIILNKRKIALNFCFYWPILSFISAWVTFWNDINEKQVHYMVKKKKNYEMPILGSFKEKKLIPRMLSLYIFCKYLIYLNCLFWGIYFKRSLGTLCVFVGCLLCHLICK